MNNHHHHHHDHSGHEHHSHTHSHNNNYTLHQQQQQQRINARQEIFQKYNQKILEYQEHIDHLKGTKNEYSELISTLEHLPDTLKPKIMVPMGKLAFFEGNIKNSNQIMVLLGENYFTKRSSKQAIEIFQRRDKDIDENIKDLNDQIDLIKQRFALTTDLSKALGEKNDENIIEIKEDYDSDQERETNQKREIKKKEKSKERQEKKQQQKQAPTKEALEKKKARDDEFDEMMRKLEILEEKERKSIERGETFDDDQQHQSSSSSFDPMALMKNFSKKLNLTGDDDEEEEEEEEDEDEDEIEEDEDYKDTVDESVFAEKEGDYGYGHNQDDDDDYNDVIEYYDEMGNLVDINDPNVEYVEDLAEGDDDNDEIEINEYEDDQDDLYLNKDGHDLDEQEVKDLESYLQEKRKTIGKDFKTTTTTTTTTTNTNTDHTVLSSSPSLKSILKSPRTSGSGSFIEESEPLSYLGDNDPKEYIKKVNKHVQFVTEKNKTVSIPPNPPKDTAFSGDIVEKETDLFPFEPIPPPIPNGAKQHKSSKFKRR